MEEYQTAIEESQPDLNENKEDEQFLTSDQAGANQDFGGMPYSEPKPIGGIYALFQDILDRGDTTRVSNLDKPELGDLGITVRDSMRTALIGNTFHHPTFAKFFLAQAGIVTDSAMSKRGWFPELFVTSKKFAQRETSSSVNLPQQQNKWTLFSKNNPANQA